jgi:hypothetical protein
MWTVLHRRRDVRLSEAGASARQAADTADVVRAALVTVLAVSASVLIGCADRTSVLVRPDVAARANNNSAASSQGERSGSAAASPKHQPKRFVIDSSIGETFELASAAVSAPLSSDQAFRRYARLNGSTRKVPPDFVRVRLGYLTLPVGPGFPDTAHHELVWAYSYHQCMSPLGNPNEPSPPPIARPCITWEFLDAADGTEIDSTQQH